MATSHLEYMEKTAATEVAEACVGKFVVKMVSSVCSQVHGLLTCPSLIITGVGPNSLGEALALAML